MKNNRVMLRFARSIFAMFAGLVLLIPAVSLAQQSKTPENQSPKKTVAETPKSPAGFHEDWTTLTLEHSTLRMQPPELTDKGEPGNHSFVRERYMVNWRPTDPFDLYVIRPKNVAKPAVILYLYSFPDDTDAFKSDAWCESAVSGGYAAVGFVSSLTGHRTRYRLAKEWFVSELQEALATSTHDVQLILDYLATRTDLDSSRVAMFGVGSGGSIAILASAADSRIWAVDLVGPWGDWPNWLVHSQIVPEEERAVLIKPEFLAKVAALDPVVWLPKMKARIVRLQDVRKNKSIPDESEEKLEAAAPDVALINEYGNGRAFLAAQPPATTFQWLKDQLKPDAKLQVSLEKPERIHFYPAIEAPAQSWPNVGKLETEKPVAAANQKDKKENNNQ